MHYDVVPETIFHDGGTYIPDHLYHPYPSDLPPPPPPFGNGTIVFQVSSTGRRPYWNSTLVKLSSLSHHFVPGYFSHVASLRHCIMCSDLIPDGPHALPVRRTLVATEIYSPTPGGSHSVPTDWTRIGVGAPFRGTCLYISSLISEVFSITYLVGGGG